MSRLAVLMILLSVTACGPAPMDVGEESLALMTVIQHPGGDWWQPPEWQYRTPADLTLSDTMQTWEMTQPDRYAVILPGTPLHCGSMKFEGINALNCANYHTIQVVYHYQFELYYENISPHIYWQQPGGGAAAEHATATYSAIAIATEQTVAYDPGQNFVTSSGWTPADLGCGTAPHQLPIAGICFSGTTVLETYVDSFWLEIRYTLGKPQG